MHYGANSKEVFSRIFSLSGARIGTLGVLERVASARRW